MNPSRFTLPPDFIQRSDKLRTLGEGTFGSVSLCDTPMGKYVVKETKPSKKGLGYPSDFITEIDMLVKLRPIQSVVKMEGVCFDTEKATGYILLEPLDSNLSEWLRNTPFQARIKHLPNLITMIGGALAIMHKFSIVHNDIKANNVLVQTREGEVFFRLCDFGKSIRVTNDDVSYSGLEAYSTPCHQLKSELRADDWPIGNVYFEEYWAFMMVLLEVIKGGDRVITSRHSDDFYRKYMQKGKFNVYGYFQSILSISQIQMIPKDFWTFIDPLITNQSIPMSESLAQIGNELNLNVIASIEKNLSRSGPHQIEFTLVEDDFKERMKNMKAKKYFKRFERLLNKFFSIKNCPEDDLSIKRYAEVALDIVLRGHLDVYLYFHNQELFLQYQREFISQVGYQTMVI